MKILLNITLFLWGLNLSSQSITGKVLDKETKEPIPFAQIHLVDIEVGAVTNEKGVFTFDSKLPKNIKLIVHAVGYKDFAKEFQTDSLQKVIIWMNPQHYELDQVTVSSHTGTIQNQSITNVEGKTLKELQLIPKTTLGESLNEIPGVYNNSIGSGISKPVIRGLSGARVVTYLNELRIENQQWGGDHGMGVSELGINKIEVIKGPSSLLYGADALGGVIYFRDEEYANIDTWETSVISRFESNSLKSSSDIVYKISQKQWRFNLFANYTNAADYQLSSGDYLKNSRYNTKNIKFSFGYNHKNWILNLRYNYMNNIIGIPGHSHDSIPNLNSYLTFVQKRNYSTPSQKINNHYALLNLKYFFTKSDLNLSIGNTINHLREFEKFSLAGINMTLLNTPYHLKYRMILNPHINLISGFQGMLQSNKNDLSAEEILIPNATTVDNAIYSILKIDKIKWGLQTGIRFDYRALKTSPSADFELFSQKYHSFNYSAGLYHKWNPLEIRFNLSSGFRAPQSSELLSNGVHHATFRYEIGNRALKSEKANQIDLGLEMNFEHISLIVNPFYNFIQDYIYLSPTDSIAQGLAVYKYQQANASQLYGIDAGVHLHPHFAHEFHLESNYSYVRAEDMQGRSFPLIPQARWSNTIRYEFDNKNKIKISNISLQHQYYFAQNEVSFFETPSKSYHLVHIGTTLEIQSKNPFELKLGVNNLFNQNYIPHISGLKNIGIAQPGRNFYISLKYYLTKKTSK